MKTPYYFVAILATTISLSAQENRTTLLLPWNGLNDTVAIKKSASEIRNAKEIRINNKNVIILGWGMVHNAKTPIAHAECTGPNICDEAMRSFAKAKKGDVIFLDLKLKDEKGTITALSTRIKVH